MVMLSAFSFLISATFATQFAPFLSGQPPTGAPPDELTKQVEQLLEFEAGAYRANAQTLRQLYNELRSIDRQLISVSVLRLGLSSPSATWHSALLHAGLLQKRESLQAEIECVEGQMHNRRIRLRGSKYEKELGLIQ